MLEHHADAERPRGFGVGELHDVAAMGHDPFGGFQKPVEDLHERRLAGAVLAEQGVDLPGTDFEVDAVIGREVAEALDDAVGTE